MAADPTAFEPPSAGFALEWRTLEIWRRRGLGFVTLTHAAGLSSTGCPALDARLPLDELFHIPERTAACVSRVKSSGGRIVAIGTTVVRALEAAAKDGSVKAGDGVARGKIGRETELSVADAVLTGVHQPGESHYELLRAFGPDATLESMSAALTARGYRDHEFGDSVLIERHRALRH
jgi:S-adenosylmethionine:tRNA ribosyltransferase-isomerase